MKLFSDKRYLPEGARHNVILYPFWGQNCEDPVPLKGRFDSYAEEGRTFFEMTDLQQADVAVAPVAWEVSDAGRSLTCELVEKATQIGKPTVIFYVSDFSDSIPLENTVVLRTSFFHSRRSANEFAIPGWSEDFVTRYCDGKLPIRRRKKVKPIVGFCGAAAKPQEPLPRLKALKRDIKYTIAPPRLSEGEIGRNLRTKAVKILEKNRSVATNIILRNDFWGGAKLADDLSVAHTLKVRSEYVQNMVESDYVLCLRGAGNFSYRLYESLSCGRIPVFVNTDCVLPYDFVVDWKDYCVWVDESEVKRIPQKVVEFHDALSDQDFVDLQYECRKLWENWIRPEGFFANFHRHFDGISHEPNS